MLIIKKSVVMARGGWWWVVAVYKNPLRLVILVLLIFDSACFSKPKISDQETNMQKTDVVFIFDIKV